MGRLTAAFLAALVLPAAGQTDANCEVSDLDEYDFMHSPVHGFLIYWTLPTTEISFMVEAEAEEWAAVGFSADGSMVGSDAVIYLPEVDDVSEHILGSQSVADIFAIPDAEDELTDTGFSQSGGDTIFSFTRYTSPDDSSKMTIPDTPDSPIYIIWAEGMDNTFGYHGQENRGGFLVDLFCGTTVGTDDTDTDTDTDDATSLTVETPAPTPAPSSTGTMEGTMEDTMEDTMGSTPAPTAMSTLSTIPPTPVLTMAPSAESSPSPAPGTSTPTPVVSASTAPVASPSPSPTLAVTSPAPVTPSITMPPGGFVPITAAPRASFTPSPASPTTNPMPIPADPTEAPIPSSLGAVFGTAAPAASAAPAATGPAIPLPSGATVAPSLGGRGIGDGGGTPPPSSTTAGAVGGAARVGGGGGVTGAAVASAVAVSFGMIAWATSV
eukprot:g3019.t1